MTYASILRAVVWSTLILVAGCGPPLPPDDEEPMPTPEACEASSSSDFEVGVVVFENPRWFRAFDEGCDTVEMETGLQGGWHIEPALQAPRDAVTSDLGGEVEWLVTADGDRVARAQFEMFESFWQDLEGGLAYWGDFVIFESNPEELIGSELVLQVTLSFSEDSSYDVVVLKESVEFVNEDESTAFR